MKKLFKYINICIFAGIAILIIRFNATAQYCIPEYGNSCVAGGYINKFTFHTISNPSSGCNGNEDNYILYPQSGATTTSVVLGGSYSLSVKSNNNDGIGIWIDYSNDGDFEDAGEFVYASPFYDNITFTGTVIIPNNETFIGQRRLRVRGVLESLISAGQSCTAFEDGETEDYIITINPAAPCAATPVSGIITAFPSSICAEGNTSELLLNGFTVASGISITWETSADGINWDVIENATEDFYLTEPLYNTTYYRARVTCINSNLFSFSNEVKINVGEVKIWSVVQDSVCGAGTVDLKVLTNANTVSWYESETSGLPVYSSSAPFVFTTEVTATKTYFASGSSGIMYIDSLGLKDNLSGSGSDAYQNNYLTFSTLKACKLAGVHVYPSAEGLAIIQLRDQNFQPISTDTFTISAADVDQRTFLELNYNLDPGLGFQLTLLEGSVPLWSNQAGVSFPYEIPGVFSLYTSNLGPNYYFYFYNWVINYTDQCETPRVAVTAYVSTAPLLNVTTSPADATICANNGSAVSLQASSGYSNYAWSPSSGLSSVSGEQVMASPLVTTTYTINATDGICQNQFFVTVVIANTPVVAVTATADSICAGTSTQLFAAAAPLLNYSVKQIEFAPETATGIPVLLGEDAMSSTLPIGFNFKFYGNYYTSYKISSNGFITFDTGEDDGCCSGQQLPHIDFPNNLIAFAWEDLSPQLGGSISHFVTGTAPNRKLVIRFDSVPHYSPGGGVDAVTAQVFLYENNNRIEIHTTSMPGNPAGAWLPHTMGIENATGTLAATVPNRNATIAWMAFEDAWSFQPLEYLYNWLPASTLDNPAASNPVAWPLTSTNYQVMVTDSSTQCSDTGNITIKLINKPKAGTIDPPFLAICEEGAATFTLNEFTSGASIQWMQSPAAGGPYADINGATGASYTTPLLDTSHFILAKVWCTNAAFTEPAMVEVMPVPSPPSGDTAYRCGPGKVELQATASGAGTISWYDAESGGNYLGQGTLFTTPPINASTNFWIEEGPAAVAPLPTTFLGGNAGFGNMFDITAINSIVLNGFDGHISAGTVMDLEIYYKKGTYSGFENDASAWTFIGSADGIQGLGIGIPTPYPVALNLAIPAGNTYSFYITAKTAGVNFTYGNAGGGVFAEDANIKVSEGIELEYPFGDLQEPVRWNGIIHYKAIGCISERTPVSAIVHSPDISTSYNGGAICHGDELTITAFSNGEGEYQFQWTPLLPSMNPANGIGSTISVTPDATVAFTITAIEVNSGCDTSLVIPVAVTPLPIAAFSGLPDTVAIADDPYLLTGIPPGGVFSGEGITGNFFDPSLAGLGGPYPITYTYTDAADCVDDTIQQTIVVLQTGIPGVDAFLSVGVYPNPSSGILHLQGNNIVEQGLLTIAVIDLYGRAVYYTRLDNTLTGFNHTIDLNDSAKGFYFVEVQSADNLFRIKVLIE